MAQETLYADASGTGTCSTPGNATGAPNGSWTTDTGITNWTHEWPVANPSLAPTASGHSVGAYLRKEAGQSGTPSVILVLRQGATTLATSSAINVTSTTGAWLSFDPGSVSITDATDLRVEVQATAAGGNPSTRTSVQVDAVRALVNTTTPASTGTVASTLPSLGQAAAGAVTAPAVSGTASSSLPALVQAVTGTFATSGAPESVATWDGTTLAPVTTDSEWNVGNLTNDGTMFGPILAGDNPTPTYASQPVFRWIPGDVDATTAKANGRFFSVTISRVDSAPFTPGELSLNIARGGSFGTRGFAIYTDADAYAASLFSVEVPTVRPTWTHYDIDLSSVGEVTTLTIRVYSWTPSTASTLEADDFEVTATVSTSGAVSGTAASTLPALSTAVAGTSTVPGISGTAASTLPALTQSAAGSVTVPASTGTAASTLPSLGQSASGTVAPPAYTGDIASTLPALSTSASGAVTTAGVAGSVASTLPALATTAEGTTTAPAFTGTIDSGLPALSMSASGASTVPAFTAEVASTLPALTSSATGTVTSSGIAGSIASTLPALTQAATGATGVPAITGAASSTLPALVQSASGTVTAPGFSGVVGSTLPALTQTATGTSEPPTFAATVATELPALGQSAAGTFTIPGRTGAVTTTLPALAVSIVGVALSLHSRAGANRTHTVAVERRTAAVGASGRTSTVESDPRTHTVAAHAHRSTVPAPAYVTEITT